MADTYDFDIIINGGGLVGTAIAIALAPLNLRIALIEPKPTVDLTTLANAQFDRRAIALSLASVNIFKALDVWQDCAAFATAIERVKISEQGRYGKATLQAQDYQLSAFGYVIPMSELQATLEQKCATLPQIKQFRPAQLSALEAIQQGWHCQIDGAQLTTSALLGCDGSRSFVRQQLGIEMAVKKLTEVAVLANVTCQQPLDHTAYERFTAHGPVALLPIAQDQATAVIITTALHAEACLNDATEFLQTLQTRFGFKLGRFTQVGTRQQHPLIRGIAQKCQVGTALLMGNAAHTLHPVAAQGFNLSLRDVAVLAEMIAVAQKQSGQIDWSTCFSGYVQQREPDQQAIIKMTESILSMYSLSLLPSRLFRSVGLQVLNQLPWLRQRVSQLGMGLLDQSSQRLVYGHPLTEQRESNAANS